jgi:hypothetical protein
VGDVMDASNAVQNQANKMLQQDGLFEERWVNCKKITDCKAETT